MLVVYCSGITLNSLPQRDEESFITSALVVYGLYKRFSAFGVLMSLVFLYYFAVLVYDTEEQQKNFASIAEVEAFVLSFGTFL